MDAVNAGEIAAPCRPSHDLGQRYRRDDDDRCRVEEDRFQQRGCWLETGDEVDERTAIEADRTLVSHRGLGDCPDTGARTLARRIADAHPWVDSSVPAQPLRSSSMNRLTSSRSEK